MELGYKGGSPKSDAKFVYLLGADETEGSSIPKDAFVVYQGHHGDSGAYYADVILPGAAFTEKSATFMNTEGRAQTTRVAVAPPAGAREDWKIIRALSEVSGTTLPYDDIYEVRNRLADLSPALVEYDQIHATSPAIAKLGLKALSNIKSTAKGALRLPIRDFYLTDPISRASATMAKCSQVYVD